MNIRLDSYQCDNCTDFFHLEQVTEAFPAACPYCGHKEMTWRSDNLWVLNEVGSWQEQALWAITKGDVDATANGRNLTPEDREMLYHLVENMDASLVMEQLQDLVDSFKATT